MFLYYELMDITSLLNPHSIAVIGASRDHQKIGSQVLSNIIKGGFIGQIYPVNPNSDLIQSLKAYPSIKNIEQSIDLVVISVPNVVVEKCIDECIEAKVKSIIIITAGFKETGSEGAKLEQSITNKLKAANIPMLGPNCLGLIVPSTNLNASFSATTPILGKIAFLSQSGAFGTAAIDWASNHNIGFSIFASLGNKAILNENDFLKNLPPHTKAVAMYLESISDGNEFQKVANQISSKIPIILLKPGKSEKAKQAAISHTGALTGADSVITTAMNQCGVLRVDTSQELFDLIKAFSFLPQLTGNKVAIITNAGGPGIMTTDAIELSSLQLAQISQNGQEKLAQILPREANIHDPIDLIGDAKAKRYEDALCVVINEPEVDAIIVILTPQSSTEIEQTAQSIVTHSKSSNKPIIAAFMGGTLVEKGVAVLNKNKIPCFTYPEQAVNTLSRMWEYTEKKNGLQLINSLTTTTYIHEPTIKNLLDGIVKEKRTILMQSETEQVLTCTNIQFPKKIKVENLTQAWNATLEIGTPVVMKISSPNIIHKTESHAVILNLITQEQVNEALFHLTNTINQLKDSSNSTIYVQKQIAIETEIIIGMKRDPIFGPVIVVGTGGIYAEIYKDTSSLIAPFTKQQAYVALTKTKVFKILNGYRNKPIMDTEPIINAIMGLSNLSLTYPQILEIDINPLALTEHSVIALDARVILSY